MVCSICGGVGHNRRTCQANVPPEQPVNPNNIPQPHPPADDPPPRLIVQEDDYFNNTILYLEKQAREFMINGNINELNDDSILFFKGSIGLVKKQIKLINVSQNPMCLYMVPQNFGVEHDLIRNNPIFLKYIEPRSVNVLDVFSGYILFLIIEGQELPSIYSVLNSKKPRREEWANEYRNDINSPYQQLLTVVLDPSFKKPRTLENIMIFYTNNIQEDLLIDSSKQDSLSQYYPTIPNKENQALFSSLKMNYLIQQMIRLGGLEHETLGSILDLQQDVQIPPHDDLDLEASGVPNKLFTNVT